MTSLKGADVRKQVIWKNNKKTHKTHVADLREKDISPTLLQFTRFTEKWNESERCISQQHLKANK